MSLSAPVQLSLPRYHLFNPLVTQRSLKFAFIGWFAEMNRTRTLGRASGARCAFSSDHDQFDVNTHSLGIRALAQLVLCPASTIFAGWRQSVLPVHLLSLTPLLSSVGPVAGDVKLQDDGVMHHSVQLAVDFCGR